MLARSLGLRLPIPLIGIKIIDPICYGPDIFRSHPVTSKIKSRNPDDRTLFRSDFPPLKTVHRRYSGAPTRMAQLLDSNDMLFHMLVVGGTGSGKTNCILYMLDRLFNKKEEGAVPPSVFLFDPAGDASIDL